MTNRETETFRDFLARRMREIDNESAPMRLRIAELAKEHAEIVRSADAIGVDVAMAQRELFAVKRVPAPLT